MKALIEENKTLSDATPELLAQVAVASASIKLAVKSKDIVTCTNLRKLIETYKVQGGPSPAEVKRALKNRNKTLTENKKIIANLNDKLADAEIKLNKTIEAYSSSKNIESVKLKN